MDKTTKLKSARVMIILDLVLALKRYAESQEGQYLIGALDFAEVAHAGA